MNQSLIFNAGGYEMLRLCDNGDIYVKTRLAGTDREVVKAFKEWLSLANQSYGGSIEKTETIFSNQVPLND